MAGATPTNALIRFVTSLVERSLEADDASPARKAGGSTAPKEGADRKESLTERDTSGRTIDDRQGE